jgi:hypothetical protein
MFSGGLEAEGDMDRAESGWHIACWNLTIFAIICAMTIAIGGLDAAAMMVG